MLARCKKTIALITLVTGSLYAGNLLAVGLGELTVNSSLNEPLDATIQVLGLDGLTENQINVSLGSLADFQRANLARVGLIDDITLEIDVLNREEGILRLSSDEAVTEPFLNMVISMRWPNGRLMRDYTALIDLPVFFTEEPQAVPLDIPETPAPAPEPEPAGSQFLAEDNEPAPPTATAAAPVAEPAPPPAPEPAPRPAAEGEVTVESGDTLFDIAASNRPSDNVSVEQTMLAIQRANPDAFIDNNINRIRVGRVLRIPSLQEIQSIDQSQAVNQIALQNQVATTQPLAFSSNNAPGGQLGNDELTILSGDEGTASLSGDEDMAATIAALENQLMISEENLDRARLENQELRARFAELEEQIEILQNIIAMQDARLAQLQADLATAQAPEPAPAETPVQAQPVSSQPPAPQDNSIMGQLSALLENTMVLVGSLVALIVLVVGFLVWRRRAAEDDMDEFAVAGATAGGPQATYTDDEPEGASAGFLAALKSRFSRSDSDDDNDDDADIEDDDDEDGGLLGKLKGLFSRSSDDDDDEDDFDEDEDEEDDDEDGADGGDDEFDDADDDDTASAFAMDNDEDQDEDVVATAEDEFDLDFDEDEEEAADGADEEVGELNIDEGEIDLGDSEAEEPVAEVAEEAEDDTESFDFSLDDTPKAEVAPAEDETDDLESFEFSVSETPKSEPAAAADEPEEVETFAFDPGSISSFEEKAEPAKTAEAEEEVETFDFDLVGDDSADENDPLAAALDEVDAESEAAGNDEDDDILDLGDIEIDDSMFDTDDDSGSGARDESSTKLDLAVAYEAMGDLDGAREILNEVIAEGSEDQAAKAKELLEKWG
jgi:pilus assembly protein FimV